MYVKHASYVVFAFISHLSIASKLKKVFTITDWPVYQKPQPYFKGYCEASQYKRFDISVLSKSQKPSDVLTPPKKQGLDGRKIVATLVNLAILGLGIASILTNPMTKTGALTGAIPTIMGALVSEYPNLKTIFMKTIRGVPTDDDKVEALVAKLAHSVNSRFEEVTNALEENTIQFEKDLIEREYKQMFLMSQSCYQETNAMEDPELKLQVSQECLSNAYRYIHSGFDKFALFAEDIMKERKDKDPLPLDITKFKRLETNIFGFWMYSSLLHDILTDLVTAHDSEMSQKRFYNKISDAMFLKSASYMRRAKELLSMQHRNGNKEHCIKTMRCLEKRRERSKVYLNCSCIIDPLMSGEKHRCFPPEIIVPKGGSNPITKVVMELRNIRRGNGFLEIIEDYQNDIVEIYKAQWKQSLEKTMELIQKEKEEA